MSTYFVDIYGALRVNLANIASVPPIAWENKNYDQDATTLYLRPTMLPNETIQASLGDSGKDLYEGMFQVDVFVPDGQGRSDWPDKIADAFKRGTVLTRNGIDVRIQGVSIAPALKEDNFYQVPVEIRWQAFTPARS